MAASEHLQDHSHQSTLLQRNAGAATSSSSNRSGSLGPIRPAPTEAMGRTAAAANTTTSASDDNSSNNKVKIEPNVKNPNRKAEKRVSWDRIHTREFTLVVGDHPMCQDGLPVSLGWQYDDHSCSAKPMNVGQTQTQNGEPITNSNPNPLNISERRQSYVFPRRLTYEERRERLISVSNLTSDEIQNDEIDLVVRTLKESWETQYVDGNYVCDNDVIMSSPAPVPTNNDLSSMVADDWMELDEIEAVPGIEGEELGDITNFEWR